jgi:hypothetical protein
MVKIKWKNYELTSDPFRACVVSIWFFKFKTFNRFPDTGVVEVVFPTDDLTITLTDDGIAVKSIEKLLCLDMIG